MVGEVGVDSEQVEVMVDRKSEQLAGTGMPGRDILGGVQGEESESCGRVREGEGSDGCCENDK